MANKLSIILSPETSYKRKENWSTNFQHGINTDASYTTVGIGKDGTITISSDVDMDEDNNIRLTDVQKKTYKNHKVIEHLYNLCNIMRSGLSMGKDYKDEVTLMLNVDGRNNLRKKHEKFGSSVAKFYKTIGNGQISSEIEDKISKYTLPLPPDNIFKE